MQNGAVNGGMPTGGMPAGMPQSQEQAEQQMKQKQYVLGKHILKQAAVIATSATAIDQLVHKSELAVQIAGKPRSNGRLCSRQF